MPDDNVIQFRGAARPDPAAGGGAGYVDAVLSDIKVRAAARRLQEAREAYHAALVEAQERHREVGASYRLPIFD